MCEAMRRSDRVGGQVFRSLSDADGLLPHKARRRPEREQVGSLAGRQPSLDGGMEPCIIPAVGALVPDLQQLLGECSVLIAVQGGLVVLATEIRITAGLNCVAIAVSRGLTAS